MLARILERSRQVIELFRELRRPLRDQQPIVLAPARPQPLHITDMRLGGS